MINIIFVIIILIFIYIIFIKKETFNNIDDLNILKEEVFKKFNMNIQGTRNFIEACKYFKPSDDEFILPADIIYNGTIDSNEFIVKGDCVLEGVTDINNLVVEGNVYIKNKNNYYTDINNINNTYLDILPVGSIIPWTQHDIIPNGWVLCDGKSYTYNYGNDTKTITTPELMQNKGNWDNFNGRRIFGGKNNIGEIGGSYNILLTNEHIPEHTHDIVIGASSPCDPWKNECYTRISYNIFSDSTGSSYYKGNEKEVFSYNFNNNNKQVPLDNIYNLICVYYIMKIHREK
jgi:hypothetical protein